MCTGRMQFNKYMWWGYMFFLPAGVMNMFMRHYPAVHPDAADGVMGLCYGLTIGCFVVGLYKARRGEV